MKLTLSVSVIAASAALMLSAPVFAGPPTKPAPAKKVPFVCPVTGEKIDDISKASSKTVYKGKTYYFCCAGCDTTFLKNPAKYVKAEPAKPAKGGKMAPKKG